MRPGPPQPVPEYPVALAQDLLDRVLLSEPLRAVYGKEVPLVMLPGPSRALGKPVYLWREPVVMPTPSTKARMLASLFDLFLFGDPHNLTGLNGRPLPREIVTQSTGNHGQGLGWFHSFMAVLARTHPGLVPLVPEVMIYASTDIPQIKKISAESFGAVVLNRFRDYGHAREALLSRLEGEGEGVLYWQHGNRPIVMGNMTSAVQMKRQIEQDPALRDQPFAVVSATGAGGRIGGMTAGLAQMFPDGRVSVIGAETTRIPPFFEAVRAGRPVPIQLPSQRVWEDGISVDQAEQEGLDVFLRAGKAVALVEPKLSLCYAHWVVDELKKTGSDAQTAKTEAVTGVSLAVLFQYPDLVKDARFVIVDETGMNIDPSDLQDVLEAPLPPEAVGLEEVDIPRPVRLDESAPPATDLWRDGWDVFPAINERLRRMVVRAANGGPVQYQACFGSFKLPQPLPRAVFEEQYMGRPLFDYLPTSGPETGYLDHPNLPPYVRLRLRQLVGSMSRPTGWEDPGFPVRMRLQMSPGDHSQDYGVPTRLVNLYRDGAMRFEAKIPAEPEFEGEHRFTMEVCWAGAWSRLAEEGWVRIDPPNPAQAASRASPEEIQIGVQDAQEEVRIALARSDELEAQAQTMSDPQRSELLEAIRLLREEEIITDPVLPHDQRNPLLRQLMREWAESNGARGVSPAQARRIFIAQQQEAGLQKDFFIGMQFKLGALRGGQRVQVMYNPNRANTPRPPVPKAGERVAHTLSDEKPIKVVVEGRVRSIKQRSLIGFLSQLTNWLKTKLNPYGYVFGHCVLPTVRQEPQAGWAEAIPATVEEMWTQAGRQTVITGNIGPKAAASLPDWAHLHDVPWRTPMDNPGDDEISWHAVQDGIRLGTMRDPGMTVFVLEGRGSREEQDRMVAQANAIVEELRARGHGEYNVWGAVTDGVGRLFITPRNQIEPEPPAGDELQALRRKNKPGWEWQPSDDYAKPLAADDYWLVRLGEQYRLMTWAELESFGLERQMDPNVNFESTYGRNSPFVRRGRPVLDIKMGSMEIRRFVIVPQIEIYEDPYLEAQLEKSYELIGLNRDNEAVQAIVARLRAAQPAADRGVDADAAGRVQQALEGAGQIQNGQQLIAFCRELSAWGEREVRIFSALPGEQRDAFTQMVGNLLLRFADQPPTRNESPPVTLVQTRRVDPPDPSLPTVVGFSVNGTLDLAVEFRTRESGEEYLEVRRSAGGYPANLVQASAALGVSVHLALTQGGTSGHALMQEMQAAGIPVTPVQGPVTRISLMIARRSGPEVRLVGSGTAVPDLVAGEAIAAATRVTSQVPAPQTGVAFREAIGERPAGTVSLDVMASESERARTANGEACVGASPGWDRAAWDRMLATRPEVFVSPLDVFARYLRETTPALAGYSVDEVVDRLRYRPEELARTVDGLRGIHGIREWLVPFRDGSVAVITDAGYWHVIPSPLLRLTYASGTNDVIMAAYLRARQEGNSPVDAARLGVTAGAIFMERPEAQRGRLPSRREVWGSRERTQVNVLPRLLPPGLARDANIFVDQSHRAFQHFHREAIARAAASAPDGNETEVAVHAAAEARMEYVQHVSEDLLPEILMLIIHERYADAQARAEEAVRYVEAQIGNLQRFTGELPEPADPQAFREWFASDAGTAFARNLEFNFWIPAGESGAYLEWLTGLLGWSQHLGTELGRLAPTGRPLTPRVPLPRVPAPAAPPAVQLAAEEPAPPPTPEEIALEEVLRERRAQQAARIAAVAAEAAQREAMRIPATGVFTAEGARTPEQIYRILEDGRNSRGVLVIPAEIVGVNQGLQRFLRQIPDSFAETIIVWGQHPVATEIVQQRGGRLRGYLDRQNFSGLADFIAAMRPDQVGALGEGTAAQIALALQAKGIPVQPVVLDLTRILQTLGVPGEILQQVGLEELQKELGIERAA